MYHSTQRVLNFVKRSSFLLKIYTLNFKVSLSNKPSAILLMNEKIIDQEIFALKKKRLRKPIHWIHLAQSTLVAFLGGLPSIMLGAYVIQKAKFGVLAIFERDAFIDSVSDEGFAFCIGVGILAVPLAYFCFLLEMSKIIFPRWRLKYKHLYTLYIVCYIMLMAPVYLYLSDFDQPFWGILFLLALPLPIYAWNLYKNSSK